MGEACDGHGRMRAVTGRKVLVTGATGFIGGRLCETLVLSHGADVRALVRNFANASRIARLPIEPHAGEIAEPKAMDEAVRGCDTVFHCAHDWHNAERNVAAVRTLVDACLRHGVRRLVHVSSFSVYMPLPNGDVDESTPAEPSGFAYADTKLEGEKTALRLGAEGGLPVVVVQPTVVYGPFGEIWTVGIARQLRARLVLPREVSEGICNPVYVDDVVDALVLAAECDAAVGERFLISGPDTVTWRAFYAAYERMLGVGPPRFVPGEELDQVGGRTGPSSALRRLIRHPRALGESRPVQRVMALLGPWVVDRVTNALPAPLYVPAPEVAALLRAGAVVKVDKARRLLGYEPAWSFERGMEMTGRFVSWARL